MQSSADTVSYARETLSFRGRRFILITFSPLCTFGPSLMRAIHIVDTSLVTARLPLLRLKVSLKRWCKTALRTRMLNFKHDIMKTVESAVYQY